MGRTEQHAPPRRRDIAAPSQGLGRHALDPVGLTANRRQARRRLKGLQQLVRPPAGGDHDLIDHGQDPARHVRQPPTPRDAIQGGHPLLAQIDAGEPMIQHGRRSNDASVGHHQSALIRRLAGLERGGGGVHHPHGALGPQRLDGDLVEPRQIARRLRQLQHALARHGVWRGGIEMTRPLQRLGVQGRDARVACVQPGRDQTRRKAGTASPRSIRLEHHGPNAAVAQGAHDRSPGDARADDGDHWPRLGCRGRSGSRQARLQPFALAAMSRAFVDDEAPLRQAAPHRARDGEGGQPRPRRRSCGDQVHDLRRPHPRVQRRRKTVKEPGVRRSRPLRQRPGRIPDRQIQNGVEV